MSEKHTGRDPRRPQAAALSPEDVAGADRPAASSERLSESSKNLMRQVALRRARALRGQREGAPSFWRAAAMIGGIGWAVALPTVIGVAAGTWIDHHWPSRFSWTLMLMFAGLVIGCVDVWTRINREQEKR